MIGSIHFRNFRVLRDATLPLSPFTLIVGPNGSGKSTVFLALDLVRDPRLGHADGLRHALPSSDLKVQLGIIGSGVHKGVSGSCYWAPGGNKQGRSSVPGVDFWSLDRFLMRSRCFSLDPAAIAQDVDLEPNMELGPRGEKLAGVLDGVRDQNPERFEALNAELSRWLPEYDRILFETPSPGKRALLLRTREGSYPLRAKVLSQGTLIALAILTLAYLPNPPSIIGLEEPDRGLHPRLLRDVRDAIYRLTNPAAFGEKREPVQVIATTHSPFFLDLFRDHPEEIVIAEKVGLEARFQRLSDRADLDEILGDASLGEVWYSGVLGGVPATT